METIIVKKSLGIFTIIMNRLANNNAINTALIIELNNSLTIAEKDQNVKLVVIEGKEGVFCTGMDLKEMSRVEDNTSSIQLYMETLRRLSLFPKIVVTKIDGQVIAGGMGFVASADYVVATSRSQFSLSEALWGLLPACVLPYLIRRIGFQIAYRMVFTANIISAEQAYKDHLIDEMNEDLDGAIQKFYLRVSRLEEKTVYHLKQYFRKLWIINEEVEHAAIAEITKLIKEPKVEKKIFVPL